MTVYAIQQKSTGGFLPQTNRRRGWTNDEPCIGQVPRLFTSERNAKMALRAWLQGVWERDVYQSGYDGEWNETIRIRPKPDRKAEDMRVIQMELTYRPRRTT